MDFCRGAAGNLPNDGILIHFDFGVPRHFNAMHFINRCIYV